MQSECQIVPFENWDESVLRWMFIKSLAFHFPGINCEREWKRVDLLIRDGDSPILVEFKFYFGPNRRHDLDGNKTGWRGRFGDRNWREFKKCVSDQRRSVIKGEEVSHCRRIIVLGYASRPSNSKLMDGAKWYDKVDIEGLEQLFTLDSLCDADATAERKLALFAVTP